MSTFRNLWLRAKHQGWALTYRQIKSLLITTNFEVWQWAVPGTRKPQPGGDWGVEVGRRALELLQASRLLQRGLPIEFFRDQVDKVRTCAIAQANGELIGIAWAYDSKHPSAFLLPTDDAFEIRGVYCVPAYRKHGVAAELTARLCETLLGSGYSRIYAVIHSRNLASLNLFRALGFTKVADLHRAGFYGPRYVTGQGRLQSWKEAIGASCCPFAMSPFLAKLFRTEHSVG